MSDPELYQLEQHVYEEGKSPYQLIEDNPIKNNPSLRGVGLLGGAIIATGALGSILTPMTANAGAQDSQDDAAEMTASPYENDEIQAFPPDIPANPDDIFSAERQVWKWLDEATNVMMVWTAEGPRTIEGLTNDELIELLRPLRDEMAKLFPEQAGLDTYLPIYFINEDGSTDPNLAYTSVLPADRDDFNFGNCTIPGDPNSGIAAVRSFIVVNIHPNFQYLTVEEQRAYIMTQLMHERQHKLMLARGVNQRPLFNTMVELTAESGTSQDGKIRDLHALRAKLFAAQMQSMQLVPSAEWGAEVDEHPTEFFPLMNIAHALINNFEEVSWDQFYDRFYRILVQTIPCELDGQTSIPDYAYDSLLRTLREFGVDDNYLTDMLDLEALTITQMVVESLSGYDGIFGLYGDELLKATEPIKIQPAENKIELTSNGTTPNPDFAVFTLDISGVNPVLKAAGDRYLQYYLVTKTDDGLYISVYVPPYEDFDLRAYGNSNTVYVIAAGSGNRDTIGVTLNATGIESTSQIVAPIFIRLVTASVQQREMEKIFAAKQAQVDANKIAAEQLSNTKKAGHRGQNPANKFGKGTKYSSKSLKVGHHRQFGQR